MKIGLASADWSTSVMDEKGFPVAGGSGWARLGQYASLLPYEVVHGTLISRADKFGVRPWGGEDSFDCDIIVMQRYMFADVARIMKQNKSSKLVILNDVDDWYWGLRPSNSAWLLTHPKFNLEENVSHYSSIVALSSGVIVSTPYLKDRLKSKSKSIDILINTVDISRFTPRVHLSDTPVIGWAGSTAHRSGDLETLKGVAPSIEREGLKFHHSGHLEGHPSFSEAVGVKSTTSPLVSPQEYPLSFHFDIGLVPLSNNPFNYAKSFIKGLEYAAAGIPFIASDVGEYSRLHNEFGMGRLAKNPSLWRKHVMELRDPQARTEEAQRNLEILAQFDISNGVDEFTRILEKYAP